MSVPMLPESDAARPGPRWLRPGLVLPEGLEAGLLGGGVVALTFALRDVSVGELLQTPSVLGTLLLEGPAAARGVVSAGIAALLYNAVHFTAWCVLGFTGSWVAARVEDGVAPRWLPLALLLAALGVLLALDVAVAPTQLGRLHLWAGGLAGLGAMGAFLAWRHPGGAGRGGP